MPVTFVAPEWLDWGDDPKDAFVSWPEWQADLTPREVMVVVEGIFGEDNLVQSVAQLRALVGRENKSFCDVVAWIVIRRLMVLLERHKNLELQFEASHTLACVGEICINARPLLCAHSRVFVDLLSCTNATLREHAVHILHTFVTNPEATRDGAIAAGLFRLACSAQRTHELETAVCTLSKLLQYQCRSSFELVAPNLPTFVMFLHSTNPKITSDAAKTLRLMTCTFSGTIDVVFRAGVFAPIVELLRRTPTHDELFSVSLQIVCAIAGRSEQHLQVVIDHDLLYLIRYALKLDGDARRIAGKTIANICAWSQHRVQQLLEIGVFDVMLAILREKNSHGSIILDAARAIANATNRASRAQMQCFVDLGCVQELVSCVVGPNFNIERANPALHALENFLKFGETQKTGEQQNAIADLVKMTSGSDLNNWQLWPTTLRKSELREQVAVVMELCGIEGLLQRPPNA